MGGVERERGVEKMSNPIEQKRQQREKVWDKARAREEKKKGRSFSDVEERVVAEKKAKAEEAKRASNSLPLGTIQRDVVNFLRGAHRAVALDEISQRVRYDVKGNEELLDSLG